MRYTQCSWKRVNGLGFFCVVVWNMLCVWLIDFLHLSGMCDLYMLSLSDCGMKCTQCSLKRSNGLFVSLCCGMKNALCPTNRFCTFIWWCVIYAFWQNGLWHCGMKCTQCSLTHWGRDEIDAISQTTFSNAFSWLKMFEFRLKFHWSLFPRVQLTISQQWFR